MSDTDSTAASAPDRCLLIRNAYRQIGRGSIRIVGRPGLTNAGSTLGSAVQWIGQFDKVNGTTYTVAIAGGEIYTYNWGTTTWSKQVSTANLTTASITLSSANRIRCQVFKSTLVVSDGTNTAFTWDGTAGAGGLTKLTNAPVFRYGIKVYSVKLTGMKDTERDAIVWSEEGTANTGYEAGGYLNVWSLGGSRSEDIVALAPRNDQLGIIRPRSTTVVLGQNGTDFKTTNTRAAVSEDTGTSSPDSVLVTDTGTFLLDSDGIPQWWPSGGDYQAVGDDCRVTTSGMSRAAYANCMTVFDPELNMIYLGTGNSGSTDIAQILCFEINTTGSPNFIGLWDGFTVKVIGMVRDSNNVPRLMMGGSTGQVTVLGLSDTGPWSDNGLPITHEIVGPALGYSTDLEKRFNSITVLGFSSSGMTNVAVDYVTPYGSPDTSQILTFQSSGFVLDVDTLDDTYLEAGTGELREKAGTYAFGRWMRPRLRHSTLNEEFGVELLAVEAATAGATAGAV